MIGRVLLLAASIGVAANTSYIVQPHRLGNHVVGEVRIGAGVACYRDGVVGPPSFLVADIGKRGVPPPAAADARLLRRRFANLAPRTLRFLYLPLANPHLVVFDASLSALCNPVHPPFKDFTGSCNEYYSPVEGMDRTSASTGCN